MKRAATYRRVSRADQSSAMQDDETSELVTRRGWSLVERFADDGISGSHDRRPGFQSMLQAARRRRFDVLVVWRADRLFRSLAEFVATLAELAELGVDFVSVNETWDTTTSSGRLLLHMIAAFAEFERAVLSERTRAGLAAARRRGARIGRPPIVVEAYAIRRLRQEGYSYSEIASKLGVSVSTIRRQRSKPSPGDASEPRDN